MEENRALVDLLSKGRGHVQELQMAAAAFQPEDPNEAAMAHVSCCPWCRDIDLKPLRMSAL